MSEYYEVCVHTHRAPARKVRVWRGVWGEGRCSLDGISRNRRKPTFAKRTHTAYYRGLIRVSPLPPSSALRFTSQRCRTRPYRPRTRSATAPCLCRTGAAPATSGLCVNSASPLPPPPPPPPPPSRRRRHERGVVGRGGGGPVARHEHVVVAGLEEEADRELAPARAGVRLPRLGAQALGPTDDVPG